MAPIGGAKVLATLSNLRRTSAQILLRCDARPPLDPTYEPLSAYPIENGTVPNSCFVIAVLAAVTQQLPAGEFTRHPLMTSILHYVKDLVGSSSGMLTAKQQSLVAQLLGVGCVIVDPTTKEAYLVRGSRVTKYALMVVTRKGHVDPFVHKGSGRPGVLDWTEIITLLNSKNITWKKPLSETYGADTHDTLHDGEQPGRSLCKEYLLRIPFFHKVL